MYLDSDMIFYNFCSVRQHCDFKMNQSRCTVSFNLGIWLKVLDEPCKNDILLYMYICTINQLLAIHLYLPKLCVYYTEICIDKIVFVIQRMQV